MPNPLPLLAAARCNGCHLCVLVCPNDVWTVRNMIAIMARPQACLYTGECERACPTQAITRPLEFIFCKESAMNFYPDWKQTVVYDAAGPQPQVLLETETLKVVLVGLMAGQKLPPHPAPAGVYHFLAGTGWMMVDVERVQVSAGATVVVPEHAKRGIEAETQLAFIATRGA